jgi:hypothetical protein
MNTQEFVIDQGSQGQCIKELHEGIINALIVFFDACVNG